ncbi:lysophosphatidylserine lipase ABHD12-like isoform X1 [Acropora millepora]|uniref:lysophosphatidylserine lipase ABHD12-like isoform X1 n=1 Tax=Acropora millepora TaxID=45264 RepID=UPI001CF5376A|nr:lysophosphatidylserine lipase ABHD12-like isoform X1 [Acropora millepora]
MSEGIRKRAAPSLTTRSNHRHEEKSDADVVMEKEQHRSLLLFLVLGLFSFIWYFIKILFGAVTLCYILCVILMYTSPATRELIIYLHPLKNPFHNLSNPVSFGLPANTVNFYISGPAGKLGAWNIPSINSVEKQDFSQANKHFNLKDDKPIILYLHGNAHTRGAGHRVQLYKVLRSLGYHVITIDYRGFGDSEGTPSENGLIEDGMAAMRWIRTRISNAPVFIWGHSLGSGVAGGVAKALCDKGYPPSGVILEAPFTSVWEGATSHFITLPFRFLPYFKETVLDEIKDVFRTDLRIADVYCPILILHDRDDHTLSIELGKKLYESAKSTRRPDAGAVKFIEFHGHGHNDIFQSDRLPGILRDFIKTR